MFAECTLQKDVWTSKGTFQQGILKLHPVCACPYPCLPTSWEYRGCCIQLCNPSGRMNNRRWSRDLQTSIASETQYQIAHGKKGGRVVGGEYDEGNTYLQTDYPRTTLGTSLFLWNT